MVSPWCPWFMWYHCPWLMWYHCPLLMWYRTCSWLTFLVGIIILIWFHLMVHYFIWFHLGVHGLLCGTIVHGLCGIIVHGLCGIASISSLSSHNWCPWLMVVTFVMVYVVTLSMLMWYKSVSIVFSCWCPWLMWYHCPWIMWYHCPILCSITRVHFW